MFNTLQGKKSPNKVKEVQGMESHSHSPIAGMDVGVIDSRVKTEHGSHPRKTGKKNHL